MSQQPEIHDQLTQALIDIRLSTEASAVKKVLRDAATLPVQVWCDQVLAASREAGLKDYAAGAYMFHMMTTQMNVSVAMAITILQGLSA